MILTATNIKEPRNRTQTRKPVMSCVSNQILFNKAASKFLILPLRLSFEKSGALFMGFQDNENGFEVHLSSNGSFAINSRPLIKKIESLFSVKKPKFYIRSTFTLTKFELTLITK